MPNDIQKKKHEVPFLLFWMKKFQLYFSLFFFACDKPKPQMLSLMGKNEGDSPKPKFLFIFWHKYQIRDGPQESQTPFS